MHLPISETSSRYRRSRQQRNHECALLARVALVLAIDAVLFYSLHEQPRDALFRCANLPKPGGAAQCITDEVVSVRVPTRVVFGGQ